jgi:hypothetical protein
MTETEALTPVVSLLPVPVPLSLSFDHSTRMCCLQCNVLDVKNR